MKELENRIINNYDLNITSIVKNEESTDGNVYNIKTDNSKYIIKIYSNIDKVNSMVELHNYLKDMDIPRIIKTKDNNYFIKYNDKYIIIYSFLEGKQLHNYLTNNIYPKELVKDIAIEVRRLHDLTLNKNFNLQIVDFASNLERKSVLHFDLTKGNIFINKGIGFIDFDDAKYGDSICDVSILLSLLFVSKKRGIDNESIKTFLDNYYKENEADLRNKELPYIKKYMNNWLDYLLNNNQFESSLKESFEFKKESINKIDLL